MEKFKNKWICGAIPALLIHCSIGSVYCWSLLKGNIASYIGRTNSEVEWAFSIAIFFLGMSASFGGKFVEKDIHKSSLISTILFTLGMLGTGFSIYFKSLIGIYICYGIIMGIGLGIGYLSPIKTLMLWFDEQKGFATGIAVMGFGLAKVIASPVIELILGDTKNGLLVDPTNIYKMFFILAVVYLITMFIGYLLLEKPKYEIKESLNKKMNIFTVVKNKTFIGIWIMFYINITCGLALISQEKDILTFIGFGAIAFVSSMTAIFNAGGRLVFSSIGDKLKDRNSIYKIIFVLSIIFVGITILTNGIDNKIIPLIIVLLCIINGGYGGGFSNLPTLLSDKFGMNNISTIHGLALSAWAFAGLSGNQLSSYIILKTNSYNNLLYVILGLYIIAIIISFNLNTKISNLKN